MSGRWVIDLSDPAVLRLCLWRGRCPRRWAGWEVPAGVIDGNGVVRRPEVIGAAIRRLLGTQKRPKAAWIILSAAASVQYSEPVPRVLPWQRRVAAESIARGLLPLDRKAVHLRVRWHRRTVQVAAVLREALEGAATAVQAAGLRVQGVETAAGVLARSVRNHVAVQVTTGHLLLVVSRDRLPTYSGCVERSPGDPLAPQLLVLLAAARQEAGDTVVPEQGRLAIIGLAPDQVWAPLVRDLQAAGWQPFRLIPGDLPPSFLPGGPGHPPPLNLMGGPRWHAPTAAGLVLALGVVTVVSYLALAHRWIGRW